MIALYNELDPFAAAWLRNLIAAGHIAPGNVDERSIAELTPSDVEGRGQRHFFAGIGAWSYALRLAGIPDEASVWTGSCPCQPFSSAGARNGTNDARHLWPVWFALIRECSPEFVFGEQVATPAGLSWLDLVCDDMERAGYAIAAADLCAASVGAPHARQRLYFMAYAGKRGLSELGEAWLHGRWTSSGSERSDSREGNGPRRDDATGCRTDGYWAGAEWLACSDGNARPIEPGTVPLVNGAPARVGRLRAYGNAIVPQVAAAFITAALEAVELGS